jgi:carboxyl-terminal processing protease
MINNLENSPDIMNFQSDDTLEFAPVKKEWPANRSELESVWRKHLKNDILKLKLSGKSDNSIKDILRSHYKRELDDLSKTRSEDVFRIYMNAFLGLMDPHTAYYSPWPYESEERSTIAIPLPETEIFLQKYKAVMKKLKIKTEDDQSPGKIIITRKYKEKNYKIGIIMIPSLYLDFAAFGSGATNYKSTTRDVRQLLNELNTQKVDGIIVDIRDNGGGPLAEAVSLSGLFIKSGPILQVETKKINKSSSYSDNDQEIAYSGPLAVVVNRMTASGSEIFAGAMQDYKRGIVIGSQTFGSATTQSIINLNNGYLKMTVAKLYRITGESNQNKGITPDVPLPSICNPKEFGELNLSNSIPSDRINPLSFKPFTDIDLVPVIKELNVSHDHRFKNSSDENYINDYIKFADTFQSKNFISLNEKKRIADVRDIKNWSLKHENAIRASKSQKAFNNYDDMKSHTGMEFANDSVESIDQDIILNESLNIIIDYIGLLNNPKEK